MKDSEVEIIEEPIEVLDVPVVTKKDKLQMKIITCLAAIAIMLLGVVISIVIIKIING